jgi:hypothetical protein
MLLYWAVPWLAWLGWKWRASGSPMTALVIAIGLIVVCERYAFGYAIDLFPDRLIYRERGWLGRSVTLDRVSILKSTYTRRVSGDGKPWEHVEVDYRLHGDEEPRSRVLALSSFRRADIELVLRWLPELVRT